MHTTLLIDIIFMYMYINNTLTEKIHSSLFEIGCFLSPTTFSRTHMATNTPRFERIVNAVL